MSSVPTSEGVHLDSPELITEVPKNSGILEVIAFMSQDDINQLNGKLQEAVMRATKNRRAAAFARGVGTLNAENDPVAQPILNAIHGVLEGFFDDFFSKNPSLDKKLKKEILDQYKKGLEVFTRAFATAKNPEESSAAREVLVEQFLQAFEDNPELRKLQIMDVSKELQARMKKGEKMRVPPKGKPDRPHGSREAWQNGVGLSVILAEAVITGFAMSNGIENYGFKENIPLLLEPGVSYLPGGVATFLTAIGGQALARSILRAKQPDDSVLRTVMKNGKLQFGALVVALGLAGITYGDYKMSQSALGISAATSGEVKGRAIKIGKSLGEISQANEVSLGTSMNSVNGVVGSVLDKEGERGGKFLFHALKTKILTGVFTGANNQYSSEGSLTSGLAELDKKKSTNATKVYGDFQKGLTSINYKNTTLQALLRDPSKSYKDKMAAISAEYNTLFAKSLEQVAAVQNKASQEPNLNFKSMIFPSEIGAFPNGAEAQAALQGIAKSIGGIPQAFAELKAVEQALSKVYTTTISGVEDEAKKAFAGSSALARNTLPDNMNLNLTIPDTKPLESLANSPLGDFKGMSADEAMQKVAEVYGPNMRTNVEGFVMMRAAIFVSLIALFQVLFVMYSLRRRSKHSSEIDAVTQECLKQIGVIVDTIYLWANDSLGKIIKRTPEGEIISRAYTEHIVWSWLIHEDSALRKFAPPTYLGEKDALKGKLGRFGINIWELMTGDIRPESDRRTEMLYQIFRERIQAGTLMTEKDIAYVLSELKLDGGGDIATRVQELSNSIAAGDAEYALRSENDPKDAEYIENANDSLILQKERELKALETKIHNLHVQALQKLGLDIVNGGFPPANSKATITQEIARISSQFQAQKLAEKAIIDGKYQLSTPVLPKKVEAPKNWFGGLSSKASAQKTPGTSIKVAETIKVGAPIEPTTIPSMQIVRGMATFESHVKKHAAWITKLATDEGRKEFITEVLDGNASIIPEDVLKSAEQIDIYRGLLSSVDEASNNLRNTRNTMDGVEDISTLESTIRSLEALATSRDKLLASHGPAFQKWFKDITQLLNGFDVLEAEDSIWNPTPADTVATTGEVTVNNPTDSTQNVPVPEVAPVVSNGSEATVDTSKLPVLTDVITPTSPVVSPDLDIDLNTASNSPLTMSDIPEGGLEVAFIRGGKYMAKRISDTEIEVSSLDDETETAMIISLEDLNLALGRTTL